MADNHQHHQHSDGTQHIGGRNWYDKSYKWLLILPALLLVLSFGYLIHFGNTNGDIIYKDVSLTGGTTVTVFDTHADVAAMGIALRSEFPDIAVRSISDIRTGQQHGFFVSTKADAVTIKKALEQQLRYALTGDNSSVEFSGSSLSAGFYTQLRNSLIAAFMLMAWVVFFIFSTSRKMTSIATMLTFACVAVLLAGISFVVALSYIAIIIGFVSGCIYARRKRENYLLPIMGFLVAFGIVFFYPHPIVIAPIGIILFGVYLMSSVPSLAVILAAFADIVMTLTVVDIIGIRLSSAGIIAFLMLIGYSVDTDILLTTRLLKSSEGTVNHRIFGAFKTGMTMTLTAIAAVGVSFIAVYTFSDTLRQIFGIILIGLVFDIFNTWISNASILKWYVEVARRS